MSRYIVAFHDGIRHEVTLKQGVRPEFTPVGMLFRNIEMIRVVNGGKILVTINKDDVPATRQYMFTALRFYDIVGD